MGEGVGAYSRLGAYCLFLPSGSALIRGGRLSNKYVTPPKSQATVQRCPKMTKAWPSSDLATLGTIYGAEMRLGLGGKGELFP